MSTFLVQNENGEIDSANAYITVEYFKDYHRSRGNEFETISGTTYSSNEWKKAIVRATDYLDVRFSFVGIRRQQSQTTQWPRFDAFDRDENYINGIPEVVKEATAEYALISLTSTINPTPTRDDRGQIVVSKQEKADVLEEGVRYAPGDSFFLPRYPVADLKLTRSGLVVQGTQLRRGD